MLVRIIYEKDRDILSVFFVIRLFRIRLRRFALPIFKL